MEVMTLGDRPWENSHHQSYFLLYQERMEKHIETLVSIEIQDQ